MKTDRLVLVLELLVFISLPAISSGQLNGAAIQMSERAANFAKGFKDMKWYGRLKKAKTLREIANNLLEEANDLDSEERSSPNEAIRIDDIDFFTIDFGIGNYPPQKVTALLGISSTITWISSYRSCPAMCKRRYRLTSKSIENVHYAYMLLFS
jgi:hypothetical protein